MAELLEDIGHNVRRLREEKGWNQVELSFHADTSPSIVSLIENGKRNPSTATLAKIAGALGVEVVDLFPKARAPLPLEEPERGEAVHRKDVYLPWLEFVNRYADRWEEKLRRGAVSHAELKEWQATHHDIAKTTDRLWQEEERETAPGEAEFSENKVMWKVVKREMQLMESALRVAKQQFEDSEFAQLRRERERLEQEWGRAADG